MYNRHLGLINAAPPLICCFSSKRPFKLFIYYQKGQTYTNSGQDLINPAGDTSWAILGVILGIIHSLKTRPPQK